MLFFKPNSSTQIQRLILNSFQLLKRNISSSIVTRSDKYKNLWSEDDSLYKMPKSKEYLSSDESSSQSSEDEKPKKKAKLDKEVKEKKSKTPEKNESSSKKSTSSSKADEKEPTWDLGNQKEIKVREWKGKLYVDIREMYLDKSGDLKPGRKGISLNAVQFRKLMDCIEEVNDVFKAKS